jgi:hypothetical protein
MANTIKLRRSATSGAIPTASQLALGELAMNTFDGKLFIKTDQSGTVAVAEIGAGGGSTVTIASTPPGSPNVGDIYWDDVDGSAYIYYDDGNTQQWVSLSAAASAVDSAFIETPQSISTSKVINASTNAGMMGPTVAINSGVSITVGANSQLTVLN